MNLREMGRNEIEIKKERTYKGMAVGMELSGRKNEIQRPVSTWAALQSVRDI
jgi:hypothetical protein